jgi:hypothetical protein
LVLLYSKSDILDGIILLKPTLTQNVAQFNFYECKK